MCNNHADLQLCLQRSCAVLGISERLDRLLRDVSMVKRTSDPLIAQRIDR